MYFFFERFINGAIMVGLVLLARYYLKLTPFMVLCYLAFVVGYEVKALTHKVNALAFALETEEEEGEHGPN